MRQLEGRVALITGAAAGIGRGVARRFAAAGAALHLVDRDSGAGERTAEEIAREFNSEVEFCRADVCEPAEVDGMVAAALARFGRVDVMVNNAGIMTFRRLADLTTADWRRVLGVDLLGAFHFVKQGFRHLGRGGAIVNVSSIHALETEPRVAPYAAAKAALVSLTRSAAIEARPLGIRVNAVLPGAIDTPMLWQNPNVRSGVEQVDRSYVGAPGEVAAAIAFLASPDAAFIQGAALVVDGGRLGRL